MEIPTVNTPNPLVPDVARLIVEAVNLRHVAPETLSADTGLGAQGLSLDSVDILEIVVAVEQRFGVKVKDTDDGRRIFSTVGSIADFVLAQRK